MTRNKTSGDSEKRVGRSKPSEKTNKSEPNYPEFNLTIKDKDYDLETSLTICSNNGSDKKKTLYHARSKKSKKPILLEIDCEVSNYNIKSFSVTVDEAKEMVEQLQKMIDYLEEFW